MPPVNLCVEVPAVQLHQELCCRFACAGHVVKEVPGPVAGSDCRLSGSMVSTGKQTCSLAGAVVLQRTTAVTTATSDNSRFALKKWPDNPTLLTLSHNLASWYSHSMLDASYLLTAHCLMACRHSHTEAWRPLTSQLSSLQAMSLLPSRPTSPLAPQPMSRLLTPMLLQ